MKAVVITQHGDVSGLSYQNVPDPESGPDDLLVRIQATALNRADLLQRRGLYPAPGPAAAFEIPGLEFAGEVEAVGHRVVGFQTGDRVMGIAAAGGHAEKIAVPSRMAIGIPPNLNWCQAAALPEVFITAYDALVSQCGLSSGESVLIHAAGSGVGTAAIQIARNLGSGLIFGTSGSDAKLGRAEQLGLDVGINYTRVDFAEIVKRETAGRGVDVIVDVIGAKYFEKNIFSLAPQGRMIVVGLLGGTTAPLDLRLLQSRRLTVRGTVLRARPLEEKILASRLFEKHVMPKVAAGVIQPVIDRVFPLSEIREAHLYMESNANFGKIILQV